MLKYDGTAPEFAQAAAELAPETTAHILAPGEPLRLVGGDVLVGQSVSSVSRLGPAGAH